MKESDLGGDVVLDGYVWLSNESRNSQSWKCIIRYLDISYKLKGSGKEVKIETGN